MDLPALRCFIAVADERHFRRAAARLHMTQPPLSARIRTLEAELGVRLFDRGPGAPVCLTAAGTVLLPLACQIVELADAARGAVDRVRRGEVGELSVATAAGVPASLLGHAVRQFRVTYPKVDLTLREMDAAHQLVELADGRIDVAVIHHVRELDGVSATALEQAELGIACRSDGPLDPRDLAGGDMILMPGTLAPACRETIVDRCRALGFEPSGCYSVMGPESFLEALGDQTVVALTPRIAFDTGVPMVWRPLRGRPLVLTTSALVDPAHGSAAAHGFAAALADGALVARAA